MNGLRRIWRCDEGNDCCFSRGGADGELLGQSEGGKRQMTEEEKDHVGNDGRQWSRYECNYRVRCVIARNNRTSKTSCPVLVRLSRSPAAAARAFEKVY